MKSNQLSMKSNQQSTYSRAYSQEDCVNQQISIQSGNEAFLQQFDIRQKLYVRIFLKGFSKSSYICLSQEVEREVIEEEVSEKSESGYLEQHQSMMPNYNHEISDSDKKTKVFQLLSLKQKQINVILEYKVINGILDI